MKSIQITINNQKVTVPADSSILDAARELSIDIPTLCYLNGYERFTSCMICVVHEVNTDRLLPSCSAPVAEGMQVETENEKVRGARKDALDFLLSEHVGDCDAPCLRACPAHMNIPLMIRQIEEGQLEEAIRTVKKDIALPAVLGRICPAPCENGCHRKSYDSALSICSLKGYVADVDLAQKSPFYPASKANSGKKVAIIGAGPTGLSAAYYLRQDGHACHVFDKNTQPGGMLRYGIADKDLPKSVLDAEIERIAELGVEFSMEHSLGKELEWNDLKKANDAIILAVGQINPKVFETSGLELSSRGIKINTQTFETSVPGVFAGGNAVSEARMAIRASAHGKNLAYSVNQFLEKKSVTGPSRRFQSMQGKIREEEVGEFMKEAEEHERIVPQGGFKDGYRDEEAIRESRRCFGCDCRKPDSCKLRQYSEVYQANQRRFTYVERKRFQRNIQHELVIYEPGKCIKCGLCVQITKKKGEKLGLTFVGRGFDVRVETPFGEPLSQGLKKVAGDCISACPTGALSWRDRRKTEDATN
ncbi:MAG: NAD(P)-binding protein [candidate division Zixibacteria bacterium]|nr:NAD(P)-binding protein [candidate division Zixibacteria bacterium]